MNALKPWHIIVLLVVVLLLFGARRLPDLAKSVGESLRIFKKEVKDLTDDDAPAVQPGAGTTPASQPGTTTTPAAPPAAPPTDQQPPAGQQSGGSGTPAA